MLKYPAKIDIGGLAVVQGNLIRNLKNTRPAGTDPNDAAGVGIAVEADVSVSGNVIDDLSKEPTRFAHLQISGNRVR